jgi:glucose-6-phosphate 1-epimerase
MDKPQATDRLNEQSAIPGVLRFEPGGGGLACAVVDTGACAGRVYLHGAHVTDWKPAGHGPVLFVSGSPGYGPGKAIRGGVPVCFPWFGPHANDPSKPSHGPARITPWELAEARQEGDALTLQFNATFEPFRVCHRVTFGRELTMTLMVENTSDAPGTFEAAQHTYLAVGDVRRVEVTGLEGVDYLDKVDGQRRKTQGSEPVRFVGETDRVYLDTPNPCTLLDPALGRTVTVKKSGSQSTVIWNPWDGKAKAMGDLGDDDWLTMACIETANAGPNVVTLEPGGTHRMTTTIGVDHL